MFSGLQGGPDPGKNGREHVPPDIPGELPEERTLTVGKRTFLRVFPGGSRTTVLLRLVGVRLVGNGLKPPEERTSTIGKRTFGRMTCGSIRRYVHTYTGMFVFGRILSSVVSRDIHPRLSAYGYPDISRTHPGKRTLTAGRRTVGRKRVENTRRNVHSRLVGVRLAGRPPKTSGETYADGSPTDGSTTGWFPHH